MDTQERIIVEVFCRECQVEITLIEELADFGLIDIINENGLKYIHPNHLQQVEKIIQFHNNLNINKEGIEVILSLLEQMNQKNREVKYLQDKLRLYE